MSEYHLTADLILEITDCDKIRREAIESDLMDAIIDVAEKWKLAIGGGLCLEKCK